MPLDDTHKHGYGGGGGRDHEHRDIENFAEALLGANGASCDLNDMCTSCTLYIIGAKSFGKWLAAHIMTRTRSGELPREMNEELQDAIAREMADMAEGILHEYNIAMRELLKKHG